MEAAMKILESTEDVRWEYDAEADVLYVSVGDPRPATGVDIGEGAVARYDEENNELVGVTLIGLRARLLEGLG
ncbi:DUF2283 domain-containing protein [Rubrobacter aplysinae]|uniref:DUF2283 domain-containing protein n=1 Tax=Rubrobacter aplysinae TaxID=909625 RepID=UPI00064BF588|nr:DUF2283 domain-containing protein [Rubrobacter aplysinae]